MINKVSLIDTFLQLVQINSESKGERQLADFLKGKLEALGLQVYEDQAGEKVGGSAGNIIGRKKGTQDNLSTILFSAHMDTVQPGQGIKPQIRDDVIYSDGTTILGGDDKAGIAAILEALEVIKEKELPHGNLEIVFTIAEEIGLLGAKNLEFTKLEAEMGFILDSGGPTGTIIVQAPYHYNLRVVIRGKAAHAGVEPEKGINAIQVAAMALARLPLGRIDQETTANFGIIKGGRATNIVPDYVELAGEIRSLDKNKVEKALELFQGIFEQVTREQGARLEWESELEYSGFNLTEQDQVVLTAIKAAKLQGMSYQLKSRGGGSDANIFNNEGGIPAVNLGIGLTNDHTLEESLAVKDLAATAEYIVQLMSAIEDNHD